MERQPTCNRCEDEPAERDNDGVCFLCKPQQNEDEIVKVKTGETLCEAAIRMGKIPGRVYVANGNPNTKKPKEDW